MKLQKGDKIPTFVLLLSVFSILMFTGFLQVQVFPVISYSFLQNAVVNNITLAKIYIYSVTSEDLGTVESVAFLLKKSFCLPKVEYKPIFYVCLEYRNTI